MAKRENNIIMRTHLEKPDPKAMGFLLAPRLTYGVKPNYNQKLGLLLALKLINE